MSKSSMVKRATIKGKRDKRPHSFNNVINKKFKVVINESNKNV